MSHESVKDCEGFIAAQPTRRWEKKHTLVVCWPLAPAICPYTCTSLSEPAWLVTGGHTRPACGETLVVRDGGVAG